MENEDNGNQIPPLEVLLRWAEEEKPRRVLDYYIKVIRTLRRKKFTFREIAEWLQKQGFEVDHNAVWRAYAKTVPDDEAQLAAEADEKLEEEEAYREAMLNGVVVSTAVAPDPAPAAVMPPVAANASVSKTKKAARKGHRAKK